MKAVSSSLVVAYIIMVLSQMYGANIIGFLWGAEAQRQALLVQQASHDTVRPDQSYDIMCQGYAAAHYHYVSDLLHTSGMLGALVLLLASIIVSYGRQIGMATTTTTTTTHEYASPGRLCLWIPPVYYLTAWTGHFVFQRDIPAVFTYGTTLRGWLMGETCAWEHLLSSSYRTGSTTTDIPEYLYGGILAIMIVYPIIVSSKPPTLNNNNNNNNNNNIEGKEKPKII